MNYLKTIGLLTSLLFLSKFSFSQKFIQGLEAESYVKGAEKIVVNEKNNSLEFIVMKNSSLIDEADHLKWLKSTVLKINSDYDFILYKKESDALGFVHYRYKEYYKGVKVEHGVYYVHIKNGRVISANGEFYDNISQNITSVNPTYNLNTALIKAKNLFISAEIINHSNNDNALTIIFNHKVPYLCYHFNLSTDKPLKHSDIYIDVTSNKVVLEINKIHTTDVSGTVTTNYSGTKSVIVDQVSSSQYRLFESVKNISTKNCNNGSSPSSTTDFTNNTANWTATSAIDKSVFDLHYGLEKTRDYYYSKFARNSYDGNGTRIQGVAHYGSGYNNAFWDGTYMVFGDGDGSSYNPFSTTDIVGHELTHAVTESSAGLVYMDEAGGLNESFSDVFGVSVDFYANPSTANFLEGEQCSLTNTPFRNMTNPHSTYQPDTYLGQYWVPSGGSDNGGVHTNSQVQNYWYYLLCQGGSGTNDNSVSYSISGIGISNAEKIAYRNLTTYLTPNSTYADARLYAIQAAIDLFGACSNNVTQCANAWYAVGVGSSFYSNAVVSQFTSNNNYSCSIPTTINFSNNSVNSTSYAWNFGDGGTSTLANPAHTYTAAGNYSVKLKSIGTSSCNTSDSIIKTNFITITNVGSPIAACVPLQGSNLTNYGITKVEFATISNTSSNASEGYKNFTCTNQATLVAGNPYLLKVTTQNSQEKVAVWIDYNNDGILNSSNELVLNSTNPSGLITTHTMVVHTPTNAVLSSPLRLRVYDDYNLATSSCVSHSYGQTEDYTLRFSATTAKPQANFFSDVRITQTNGTVNFYDSTLNAPTNWKWTFQGGSPAASTIMNPTINYPSVGTYSVKLVATNSFGADSIVKIGYINVVNVYNMCAGTNSTSASIGTIYDSGGLNGNYQNGENCQFIINPGCPGLISLSFSQFSTESCCDALTIYNGTNTAAPILGTYQGLNIPPTITANSGKILLKWYTDGSITDLGFTATWTSTLSGTTPPTANYSVSTTTPPLNTTVQFTDQTTNSPYIWNWQFSDGTSSSSQNPIKSFATSGIKTITLTATNCNTTSVAINTINVQSAPSLTVTPANLSGVVNCGDSLIIPLTLTNNGAGALVYNSSINGASDSVKVLVCSYGVDMTVGGDYSKTLNAISNYYTKYSVTQYSGNTTSGLQSAMVGMDVVLFPLQTTNTDTHYSTYTNTLNTFVTNGGTVIFCGSNGNIATTRPISTGLFTGTYSGVISNYSSSIILPNDSLVYGIGVSSFNANLNYMSFTDATKITPVTLTSYAYDVVSYKNIGAGKAIFIGSDFSTSNPQFSYILARAIKKSKVNVGSLSYLSPSSGSIIATGTQSSNVVLKTNGKSAGVYTATLSLTGNNPTPNPYLVPITYTINGAATSSVSVNCINFGTIMQYTYKKDSVVLYNLGCSPMAISSLSITNSAYSYTPSASFTLAPWSNRKVFVKLNPLTSGSFNDTLRIVNNGGNIKVCLNASVTPAPTISVTPSSLSISSTCGNSQTTTLTIANNGGANLTYTTSGTNQSSNVKVLVITNLVYPNYVANMLSALNTYSVNYTVTQHTLTSNTALQTALLGKDILIVPQPYNGTQYVIGSFQTYSNTINNFVSNGGTTVMSGFYNTNMMNDLGLFNSNYSSSIGSGNVLSVTDTNDVIMRGLSLGNITSNGYNYYHTLSSGGITNYMNYSGSYSMVSKKNIGLGRAIYLGFDYSVANDIEFNKILANSVRSSVTSAPWLSGNMTTSTVTPSGSSAITYTFNSSGLIAGVYTSTITINSNDPLTPSVAVPVTFSISGSPTSSVSSNCKYFGSITQYTNKTDSLILYNTGCATMSVSSLSTTNSVYTFTPNTSFTIAAFSSKKIAVMFSPTSVGLVTDTLRVICDGGNQKVCLSGTGLSAPVINVSPSSISSSLTACNTTNTVNITVTNSGGSNLTYTLSGSSSTGSVNILVIMNNVSSINYQNMINALNTYSTNYTIIQHTLTTISNLQNALIGKQVLLLPQPSNGYITGQFQTYSTTIGSFANSGGTVIMSGLYNVNQVNDIGLFNSATNNYNSNAYFNVVDTNDVIMAFVPFGSYYESNYVYYNSITNANAVNYIKYGTYSIVSKRVVGLGRAILLGYDFYNYNTIGARILSNSVKSAGGSNPSWLSTSSTSATVTPSSSSTITYTFNSGSLTAGTYTSNVIISSNDPLTPTYTVPVTMIVSDNPCAGFVYTNSNNCTGVVSFTNNTVNTVTSYSWNFGNGTNSTLANPTTNYTSIGNYTINLTACNGTLCSSSSKTISISGVGGPISNSCTPISYLYGSNYGILNVKLNTINKSSGYSNPEGYQDFSCNNQTTLTLGTSYSLVVTTSSYANENVAVWIDFDNNGSFSQAEQILNSQNVLVTHTLNFTPPVGAVYNTPLRMRVIDDYSSYTISSACYNSNYGQAEDYTIKIQPNNVPPIAIFNTQVNSCQGTVNFTDNSLNNPTSWLWNFGDGNASSSQNPIHTYTASGTYTVLLIATNSFGSNYNSQLVTVNPLAFNIGITGTMTTTQLLTYTTSLNGGLSYTWDFGDGNLSGSQNATHIYSSAGTYTVKLTIISGGCVNTVSTVITIATYIGIEEKSLDGLFSIYPNPFNSFALIKLKISETADLNIELLNTLGQKIKTITDKKTFEKGEYEYSTDYLSKGIYFLKVIYKGKPYLYKLISIE